MAGFFGREEKGKDGGSPLPSMQAFEKANNDAFASMVPNAAVDCWSDMRWQGAKDAKWFRPPAKAAKVGSWGSAKGLLKSKTMKKRKSSMRRIETAFSDEDRMAIMQRLFIRYDLDQSGTINSDQELKDLAVNAATWFKLVLDVNRIDAECDMVMEAVGTLPDGSTALEWDLTIFDNWFKIRIEALDEYQVPDVDGVRYPHLLQLDAVSHHLAKHWKDEPWTMQSALDECYDKVSLAVLGGMTAEPLDDKAERQKQARLRNLNKTLTDFDTLAVVSAQRYVSDKESGTTTMTSELTSLRERRLQFQDQMAERQAMQAATAKRGLTGMWENMKMWLADNASRHFNEFPLLLASVRRVEGNFGSGVGSYFRFLRWIMLLNLVLGFISFGLLVYPNIMDTNDNFNPVADITPAGLITGSGLEKTWVFYGGYKPSTTFLDNDYDMALAYALSVVVMFVFSLAQIISRIFIERGRTRSGAACGDYTPTIMSQQDFSVTSQSTQATLSQGCAQQLRIHIADEHTIALQQTGRTNWKETCLFILRRLTGFSLAVGVFVGAIYLNVWVLRNGDDLTSSYGALAVPLMLVTVKQSLPIFVNFSVWIEARDSIEDVLQVTMLRVYFFKLFTLLVWFWELHKQIEDGTLIADKQDACVETEIAKIFYEAMAVDMFVVSGACIVGSIAQKKVLDYTSEVEGERVVLDHTVIGDCVIDLMYRQAMIWSGAILCPILCLWGFVMNLIIFNVQCHTFVRTHGPPLKPWGASDSNKFFLYLLLATLAIAAVPAAQFFNDAKACGPFVSVASPLESFQDVIKSSDLISDVLSIATNKWLLCSLIVALGLLAKLIQTDLTSSNRELSKSRDSCALEKSEKETLIRRFCEAGMTKEELGRNRKNIDLVDEMKSTDDG